MKVIRLFATAVLTVMLFWASLWLGQKWLLKQTNPNPMAVMADTMPANLLAEEKNTIHIYQRVSPAVVNITTTKVTFDHSRNPVPSQGTGSGVLLTQDGYIVTNNHVIEQAKSLEVTLPNGKSYEARLVGIDPSNDLAVLKVQDDEAFPKVALGDSGPLQVGQNVYVIGNPFGLNSTLSRGVVSSLNRSLRAPNGRLMEGIIQTDAAINPGNSGGPMLNSTGQLIGITTAIFSPTGSNAGIGFAIPALKVQKVVNDIIRFGKVIRPYLGTSVSLQLTPRVAKALNLPVESGLMIGEVAPHSPAEQAGLLAGSQKVQVGNHEILLGGDIILAADGKTVQTTDAFISLIEAKAPHDTIELTLLRNGGMIKKRIVLTQRPEN